MSEVSVTQRERDAQWWRALARDYERRCDAASGGCVIRDFVCFLRGHDWTPPWTHRSIQHRRCKSCGRMQRAVKMMCGTLTEGREAQLYNRLWKRLGVRARSYVPLPPGAGTCRTPPVVGTDDQILDQLLAQTTGYQPRRSEA